MLETVSRSRADYCSAAAAITALETRVARLRAGKERALNLLADEDANNPDTLDILLWSEKLQHQGVGFHERSGE